MELVAPLTAVVCAARGPVHTAASTCMLGLFVVHYINRAIIQPWLNPPRTPLHGSVVVSAILFNLMNGFMQGVWLTRGGSVPKGRMAPIVGVGVWACGSVGNIWHDALLRRLRRTSPAPDETVIRTSSSLYRIPQGGAFAWISYPHYVCECRYTNQLTKPGLEWAGWAFACVQWVPHIQEAWYMYPPILFVLVEIAVMAPRAWRGHEWYRQRFGHTYPARWALVPGLW